MPAGFLYRAGPKPTIELKHVKLKQNNLRGARLTVTLMGCIQVAGTVVGLAALFGYAGIIILTVLKLIYADKVRYLLLDG